MAPTPQLRVQAKPRASAANYVIWGSLALCAVLMTSGMVALSINSGRNPFSVAQTTTTRPPAQPVVQRQGVPEFEVARLQDAIRAMAAEREQLTSRIDQLERSMGDITASINTVKERAMATPPPAPPPTVQSSPSRIAPSLPPEAAAPSPALPSPPPAVAAIPPVLPQVTEPMVTTPPTPPVAEAAREPAAPPLAAPKRPGQISQRPPTPKTIQLAPRFPPQATRPRAPVPTAQTTPQTQQVVTAPPAAQPASPAESVVTKTEFGIDLGGETSMAGLRAKWANVKGNHSTVLDGMKPLVSVREGQKPGTVELRLIAGPVPNAGTAARLCANLQTTGVACQTTEYDGQKLSLR